VRRKQPLTRDTILDAALELLDRHGLDNLSMRRLGSNLGVEAMSLYNHVASKGELLDGIHERILLSLEPPANIRGWQSFCRHQAHALHRALLAHPHAIPLFATRPAATPAAIGRLNRYVEVLARAGFRPVDALSVVQLVAQLVVGHTMWTISLDATPHQGPDRELEMGIDALLHGFERLLS
jgi:AcrR family transcriptional regulator